MNTRELITYALRELERIEEVFGPGWAVDKNVIWALRDAIDEPEAEEINLLYRSLDALKLWCKGPHDKETFEIYKAHSRALTHAIRKRLGETDE